MTVTRTDVCRLCGSSFEQERRRGRPKVYCPSCIGNDAEKQRAYYEANRAEIREKQRAYYEANRAEIREKQRAYREANRAEIREKKRAYREANRAEIAAGTKLPPSRWHCDRCGEPLRRQTEDGLCGFCRQGIAT